MTKFATYLYPHTCYTSQQRDRASFVGYSFPYFSKVRQNLAKLLQNYPTLPIKKAQGYIVFVLVFILPLIFIWLKPLMGN